MVGAGVWVEQNALPGDGLPARHATHLRHGVRLVLSDLRVRVAERGRSRLSHQALGVRGNAARLEVRVRVQRGGGVRVSPLPTGPAQSMLTRSTNAGISLSLRSREAPSRGNPIARSRLSGAEA
jgi:hypothetical protein